MNYDNAKIIYEFFKSKFSNEYAIFGIIANLHAESGLKPNNAQNSYKISDAKYVEEHLPYRHVFSRDKIGFGLAQWTHWERKERFWDWMIENVGGNVNDWLDVLQQCKFIWYELDKYYHPAVEALKISTSIYKATEIFCKTYEQPKDTSETAITKRSAFGEAYYNFLASKREYLIHEVQNTDTLLSISKTYGKPIRDIVNYNDLHSHTLCRPSIIKIPLIEVTHITHRISKGETLRGLAKAYLGDAKKYTLIKEYNNMVSDTIRTGNEIKIPI